VRQARQSQVGHRPIRADNLDTRVYSPNFACPLTRSSTAGRDMLPLYRDPHFTFRFAEDRLVGRFHLDGVEPGTPVPTFALDPATGERREPIAAVVAGDGGWVALPEALVVRSGGGFVAVAGSSRSGE
jgi:hypothetical protein